MDSKRNAKKISPFLIGGLIILSVMFCACTMITDKERASEKKTMENVVKIEDEKIEWE